MKFVVEGTMQGAAPFKIEIEAETEKHARELALIRLGSTSGMRKTQISIIKVQASKK